MRGQRKRPRRATDRLRSRPLAKTAVTRPSTPFPKMGALAQRDQIVIVQGDLHLVPPERQSVAPPPWGQLADVVVPRTQVARSRRSSLLISQATAEAC